MESSEVVKIRVENIYPHPDNPRKDLGDVTELAESMKKHGVMRLKMNVNISVSSPLEKTVLTVNMIWTVQVTRRVLRNGK